MSRTVPYSLAHCRRTYVGDGALHRMRQGRRLRWPRAKHAPQSLLCAAVATVCHSDACVEPLSAPHSSSTSSTSFSLPM
eukprot:981425-Prymnesium_polylepis.1